MQKTLLSGANNSNDGMLHRILSFPIAAMDRIRAVSAMQVSVTDCVYCVACRHVWIDLQRRALKFPQAIDVLADAFSTAAEFFHVGKVGCQAANWKKVGIHLSEQCCVCRLYSHAEYYCDGFDMIWPLLMSTGPAVGVH